MAPETGVRPRRARRKGPPPDPRHRAPPTGSARFNDRARVANRHLSSLPRLAGVRCVHGPPSQLDKITARFPMAPLSGCAMRRPESDPRARRLPLQRDSSDDDPAAPSSRGLSKNGPRVRRRWRRGGGQTPLRLASRLGGDPPPRTGGSKGVSARFRRGRPPPRWRRVLTANRPRRHRR